WEPSSPKWRCPPRPASPTRNPGPYRKQKDREPPPPRSSPEEPRQELHRSAWKGVSVGAGLDRQHVQTTLSMSATTGRAELPGRSPSRHNALPETKSRFAF